MDTKIKTTEDERGGNGKTRWCTLAPGVGLRQAIPGSPLHRMQCHALRAVSIVEHMKMMPDHDY